MSGKGPNLSSLTLAIADLKAIDARLSALGAADPPIESDGTVLTAAIRESQALVRAAIARLTGGQVSGEAAGGAANQGSGGAKRRVKVKAASETTLPASPARAEAVARLGGDAPKASAKSAARGGDRARGASTPAASAAQATTATAPPSSLLARLGAAAPEPGARRPATADGGDTSATARQPDSPSTYDTADRLARLEAEIDSLTSTTTGDPRSKATTADARVAPAAKPTAAQPRHRSGAAPVPAHQPGVCDDGAEDDEDDAEIVIVTDAAKAAGSARQGPSSTGQGPRVFRDPPPGDDSDAEVEIVQPGARPSVRLGADARDARLTVTPDGDRAKAAASKPAAPAKWRLFRGSS